MGDLGLVPGEELVASDGANLLLLKEEGELAHDTLPPLCETPQFKSL